jgi:hypothetical protein
MSTVVFWVVTLCTLVGCYQCFGEKYCPHLHVQTRRWKTLQVEVTPTRQHDVTTQNTTIEIFTTVRTSSLITSYLFINIMPILGLHLHFYYFCNEAFI